jgi:hypothetical protein
VKRGSLVGAVLWTGFLGITGCTTLLGDFHTAPELSDTGAVTTQDATDLVESAGLDQTSGDQSVGIDRASGDGSEDASAGDVGSVEGGAAEAGCSSAQLSCGGNCVANDAKNCGTCGNDCTALPHVTGATTCMSGHCTLPVSACVPGFADCDGNSDNGCETDLSQASHCGSCSVACTGGTPQCAAQGASFACSTGCAAATPTLCGMSCVDTAADPNNCGTCGHACPAVMSGKPTCLSGACDFACDANFHKCGAACADNTSTNSCGPMSCTACPVAPANGIATCDGTNCDFSCNGSFHRCGSSCADNTSVSSCGAACGACPNPANGTATCNGVSCGILCSPNYSLCSGACVNEQTDNAHCGSCAKQCSTTANCTSGYCVVREGQTMPISTASGCVSNYMFGISVIVPNAITVTALASIIKTVAAGNTFVMGLYTTTGTQPGTLVVQTGAAVMNPLGNQELPVTPTLISAGTYWIVANTGPQAGSWAWGYAGPYFYETFAYTGTMPATMPPGNGSGTGFNYYLVGYE